MVFLSCSLLIISSCVKNNSKYQDYFRSTGCKYNFSIVTSIHEGLDLCRTSTIDTVLLDASISDSDGLAFLESLAAPGGIVDVASPGKNQPTVILVATEGDPKIAVRAMKLGAQDYLLERDLTAELLQSAVASGIEKNRVQLQLQKGNNPFRVALDNVLDSIGIFSAIRDETGQIIDFRFEYLNPSALAHNRITVADMHRGFCEMFPSVRETGVFGQYCRVVETGEPLVQDNFIYSSLYGTKVLDKVYDLQVVKLEDGVIATWRDITDRKQSELALQASEQRYKALIDITSQIVWNTDAHGKMLYANSGSFTGQSFEESESGRWMEAIHPDDRQRTIELWVLATTNLTPFEIEHRVRRWDGEYRLMSGRGVPLFDNDGSLREWVGLHTDITEVRQDEQHLRRSEEFNRRILENNQDCIKLLDLDGRLLYMNENGQKLFEVDDFAKYDRAVWAQFWTGNERNLAQAALENAIAGTLSKFEGQCSTVTGTPKWWEVSVIPLHDQDGNVDQILVFSHDLTERRQAENALLQSRALTQRQLMEIEAIYQTAPIGMAIIDVDLRFQRINQMLAEINGVTMADHFGRTVRDVLGDLADGNEPLLRQVLETGKPLLNLELSGETKAQPGIYRTWISSFYPLNDKTGQTVGINVVVQEITDRKIAEAALNDSKTQRDFVLAAAKFGDWSLNLNDGKAQRSLRHDQIFGYESLLPEWTFEMFLAHVLPEDRAAIERQYHDSIQNDKSWEFECRIRRADDQIRWIWVSGYSYQKTEGEVNHMLGLVADITDRKVAEAALVESEDRFRSTFEQAAVGIGHIALDGRWLLVNPKLCEICGYTPDEFLGGTFQDITHPDDLAQDQECARQLLADEIQSIEIEKRYIHKLGHIIWIRVTGILRRDASGTPLYFISSIEDISHRKQAEFTLQAQAVKLAETTALVELRNQELNRFSHTVSHDLKAPLRGISNLAGWIQEDLPATVDPDILANLELMRSRVSRMDSLIDGLLNYAKVGNTEGSLETFSVEQLLVEIVDSLSIPASFVVELPTELPSITTHRVLLNQVLANLIGNAYKHHNRSDGRIQINVQPDGEIWRFSVTDDGPGIAPENQERVFDIFKTVSGNDKNNTGIGLSIVKKLVENHGGQVTLESQLGIGTTFSFTWSSSRNRDG